MKKNPIRIAIIADLHFGAGDSDHLLEELDASFFKRITKYPPDMIVIAGDTTHKALSINDKDGKNLVKFMVKLKDFCHNGTALRIIKGTNTHDRDQLSFIKEIFSEENEIDVDFIEKMKSESFHNYVILYLPEEYVSNDNYHLDEMNSLGNNIDFCFGHGDFNFAGYTANHQESEVKIKKTPTFKRKDFEERVKEYTVFGHVHKHMHKGNVYYTGSFSRWVYGEEDPKGFLEIKIDKDINRIKFIENKLAPKFITHDISDIINSKKYDLKEKIEKVKELIDNGNNNRFILGKETPENENDMYAIESLINGTDNTKSVKELESKEDKQEEKIDTKFKFLLDDKIPIINKIQKYVMEKYGETLNLEELEELLTKNDS